MAPASAFSGLSFNFDVGPESKAAYMTAFQQSGIACCLTAAVALLIVVWKLKAKLTSLPRYVVVAGLWQMGTLCCQSWAALMPYPCTKRLTIALPQRRGPTFVCALEDLPRYRHFHGCWGPSVHAAPRCWYDHCVDPDPAPGA
jgi:hypothetical protein